VVVGRGNGDVVPEVPALEGIDVLRVAEVNGAGLEYGVVEDRRFLNGFGGGVSESDHGRGGVEDAAVVVGKL